MIEIVTRCKSGHGHTVIASKISYLAKTRVLSLTETSKKNSKDCQNYIYSDNF
ncbi:hypothetical protein GCM10009123_05930 [Kangiella japonica]|uniref:Uncharacterized protein n=1 Tax=Kangiella japonica TaxID=647384 RepID=A0ABP3CEL8_9GAMM